MSLRKLISPVLVVAVVSLLLWLWFHPRPTTVVRRSEEAPPPFTPLPAVSPVPAPSIPPPTVREAQEKLDLCFKKTLELDASQQSGLLSGDFNGDSSMDLAAVVKPRPEGVAELNGDYPNWILQDVTYIPGVATTPAPVRVEPTDTLLAIVHGYQAEGWRHPDGRQAYLLKNAMGEGLKVVPLETALRVVGRGTTIMQLGDTLSESIAGRQGFLVWSGAQYVWRTSPQSGKPLSRDK